MSARHTPGPWSADEDPMDDQGYKTLITLPDKTGGFGTWLAHVEHNWNDAEAGQRRISWAEAEANARMIDAAPDMLHILEAIVAMQALRYGDATGTHMALSSLCESARAAIAKATGA